MGVPSVSGQELFPHSVPSVARAPSGGAPESAPKEAAQPAPDVARNSNAESKSSGPDSRIQKTGTRLRVDEATKRVVAQIVDENNEVIRQIPAEELLELAARMKHLEGVLFDRNV